MAYGTAGRDQRRQAGGGLGRFARDCDGSMTIFLLFLLVVVLMISGTAVDVVRYESDRARLQSVLDRATLAAADLEQSLEPELVVRDFAEREGLLDAITDIEVTNTFNSRTVTANAEMLTDTIFMPLLGIHELEIASASAATEQVLDIEVMMVLDVSGSMNDFGRIDALETAALNFVDILKSDDTENRVTIGIVPFNGQVNLGPQLLARYNVQHVPYRAQVACVDLPPSAYAGGTLSRTTAMDATGYVDLFSNPSSTSWNYTSPSSNAPRDSNVWCQDMTANQVLLPTANVANLNAHISGLTAIGATSINAGLRWGMALIDPGARPLFQELRDAGIMGVETVSRPYNHGEVNTMKVIVLMTDGEHFAEERLNAGYRSGLSPIYRAGDGRYSIHHPTKSGTSKYWWPHSGEWRTSPYPDVSGATQLDWRTVWNNLRMRYVAWEFYGRAFGSTAVYQSQVAAFRTQTPTATMDAQLQTVCAEARGSDVVIFGVSFEAPDNARQLIFDCSFSPSHFYDAEVDDVRDVFEAIANQIQSLRLIQ